MENMLDIYDNVRKNNIIDNKAFLRKMLDNYKGTTRSSASMDGKGPRYSDFYNVLTKTENKELDSTQLDEDENNKFYVDMTNIWIDNVLKLDNNDLKKLTKKYQDMYIVIRDVVKKYGRVNSIQKVKDLYDAICDSIGNAFGNSLEDGIFLVNRKKLFWVYFQDSFGFSEHPFPFNHVSSNLLSSGRKEEVHNIEYRLYINCACKDIVKLVSSYIDKCDKKNIPFYFKYSESRNRRDKVVIFCSKEHIKNNIEILKEIAKEHPEYVCNCGPMLDLVGNIDGWIGIASEPSKSLDCKQSFNTLRSDILEDAAENVVLRYIFENINKKVIIDGKEQSFNKIILDNAINIIINKIKRISIITKKDYDVLLQDQKYIDYLRRQLLLKTETGKNTLMNGFNRLVEIAPSKNKPLGLKHKTIFEIDLLTGDKIDYTAETADEVLKSMVDVMMKTPSFDYISKYREEIKKLCPSYMVDPSCFAFNTTTKNDFENIDSVYKKKYTHLQKLKFIRAVYNNLPVKDQNRRVLIGDKISIPLKQYFEEFLVSYIDDNFNYVTDSFEVVSLIDKIVEILENSIPSDTDTPKTRRAKIIV